MALGSCPEATTAPPPSIRSTPIKSPIAHKPERAQPLAIRPAARTSGASPTKMSNCRFTAPYPVGNPRATFCDGPTICISKPASFRRTDKLRLSRALHKRCASDSVPNAESLSREIGVREGRLVHALANRRDFCAARRRLVDGRAAEIVRANLCTTRGRIANNGKRHRNARRLAGRRAAIRHLRDAALCAHVAKRYRRCEERCDRVLEQRPGRRANQ